MNAFLPVRMVTLDKITMEKTDACKNVMQLSVLIRLETAKLHVLSHCLQIPQLNFVSLNVLIHT
jgi:hypothetical protein